MARHQLSSYSTSCEQKSTRSASTTIPTTQHVQLQERDTTTYPLLSCTLPQTSPSLPPRSSFPSASPLLSSQVPMQPSSQTLKLTLPPLFHVDPIQAFPMPPQSCTTETSTYRLNKGAQLPTPPNLPYGKR